MTAARATAIQQQAVTDLKAVRRAALADLANASGLAGSAATAYVSTTELKLDDGRGISNDPGVLLPDEYLSVIAYLLQLNGMPAGKKLSRQGA